MVVFCSDEDERERITQKFVSIQNKLEKSMEKVENPSLNTFFLCCFSEVIGSRLLTTDTLLNSAMDYVLNDYDYDKRIKIKLKKICVFKLSFLINSY